MFKYCILYTFFSQMYEMMETDNNISSLNNEDLKETLLNNIVPQIDNETAYNLAGNLAVITAAEKYVTLFLCVVGLIGNTFSTVIFSSRQLRKSSCSFYLVTRGISDNIFLVTVAISWVISALDVDFAGIPGLCKCIVFFTYISGFTSVWLTVLVCFENLMVLKKPRSSKTFGRFTVNSTVLLSMVGMAVAMYVVVFWVVHDGCGQRHEFRTMVAYFVIFDTVVTFVLPSVFMVIVLVLTVFRVRRLMAAKQRNSVSSLSLSDSSINEVTQRKKCITKRPYSKVTVLLFIFSLSFIILHLPSHMFRCYIVISSMAEHPLPVGHAYWIPHLIFQSMYYTSFSVNFLIFWAFGSNFKKVFQYTFCGFRTEAVVRYVPVSTLNVVRPARPIQRRHTIAVGVVDLASLTLSKDAFLLKNNNRLNEF